MRDDVVHLTRDPRPLRRRGKLRALLSLSGELVRSIDKRLNVAAPIAQVDRDEQHREQPQCVEHDKFDQRAQVGV